MAIIIVVVAAYVFWFAGGARGLHANAAATTTAQTQHHNSSVQQATGNFTDAALGFSMNYPAAWNEQRMNTTKGTLVKFYSGDGQSDAYLVATNSSNMTLNESVQLVYTFERYFNGSLIEQGSTDFGAAPGYGATFLLPNGMEELVAWTILSNGTALNFFGVASNRSTFDSDLGAFRGMLGSFSFAQKDFGIGVQNTQNSTNTTNTNYYTYNSSGVVMQYPESWSSMPANASTGMLAEFYAPGMVAGLNVYGMVYNATETLNQTVIDTETSLQQSGYTVTSQGQVALAGMPGYVITFSEPDGHEDFIELAMINGNEQLAVSGFAQNAQAFAAYKPIFEHMIMSLGFYGAAAQNGANPPQNGANPQANGGAAGGYIAYSTGSAVWIAPAQDMTPQQISLPLVSVGALAMAASANGGLLASTGQSETDYSNEMANIYAFAPNGAGFEQVTDFPTPNQGTTVVPMAVAVSPDGSQIAYMTKNIARASNGQGESSFILWLCDVADCASPGIVGELGGGESAFTGYGLSWSPDGTELAVPSSCVPYPNDACPTDQTYDTPVICTDIYLVPAQQDGQQSATPITQCQGSDSDSTNDAFPAFSPNGAYLAFVRYDYNTLTGEIYSSAIYVMDIATGSMDEVVSGPSGALIRGVSWVGNNELVFGEVSGNSLEQMATSTSDGIYEVGLSGEGLTQVSQDGFNPVWIP